MTLEYLDPHQTEPPTTDLSVDEIELGMLDPWIRPDREGIFRKLSGQIVGEDDPRIDLPFHMTLAAIEMRDNTGTAPYPLVDDALPAPAVTIADAVLDVLHTDLPERRTERMLQLVDLVSRKDEQD